MLQLALAPPRVTPPPPTTITWNPMAQQFVEDDTTFLLDPDVDAATGIGINSGAPGALLNQHDASAPTLTAGKFRTGVQPTVTSLGGLWMPVEGILGVSEFTVEFWITLLADLASLTNRTPVQIGGHGLLLNHCRFTITSGRISVTLVHQQNPAVSGVYSVTAQNATAYTTGTYPAGTKLSIAATLKAGVLTLFVGKSGDVSITQINQQTGIVPPQLWGSNENTGEGILIGSGKEGVATSMVVDSVRVSRYARTPDVSQPKPTDLSTITVANTTTGATVQKLNGVLKPFIGGTAPSVPIPAAGVVQAAQRGTSLYRCGKFLSCTPMKTGAPDGTRPTAGHSNVTSGGGAGGFSYDWQLVDRELHLAVNTYGMEPYINFDSCPQLLGGGVAPASGTALTTGYAFSTKFANQIPNDLNAFATMSADLVYHVLIELGIRVNYWAPWNEPDGPSFWPQGPTAVSSYLAMYGAIAPAVKAIDPTIQYGGPELAQYQHEPVWTLPLINYCAANSLPLDWVAFHYYSGNPSMLVNIPIQVLAWCAAAGIPAPGFGSGEWSWGQAEQYPFTQPVGTSGPDNPAPTPQPFTVNYTRDDWAASFFTYNMIVMQNNGFVNSTVAQASDKQELFDTSGVQQASYNAMLQWSKTLGNSVVSVAGPGTAAVDPGMQVLASKDGGGKVYVLIANMHNRRTKAAYPIKIDLTAFGLANGTNVTTYTVDDLTSNAYYGSGPALASTSSSISSGLVNLNVRARSSTLVVAG